VFFFFFVGDGVYVGEFKCNESTNRTKLAVFDRLSGT